MTTNEQFAPGLDAARLAALRARLEDERRRLLGILKGLDTEVQNSEPASEGPESNDPEDFGEMGRDIMLEDTGRVLAAEEERLLAQVEHAVLRMDQGTYGRSEVTGEPIPLERLEALPWATTNVGDEAAQS